MVNLQFNALNNLDIYKRLIRNSLSILGNNLDAIEDLCTRPETAENSAFGVYVLRMDDNGKDPIWFCVDEHSTTDVLYLWVEGLGGGYRHRNPIGYIYSKSGSIDCNSREDEIIFHSMGKEHISFRGDMTVDELEAFLNSNMDPENRLPVAVDQDPLKVLELFIRLMKYVIDYKAETCVVETCVKALY